MLTDVPDPYIDENGDLHYGCWWGAGGGHAYNRDCLGHDHPEQTYNYLKRFGFQPEDWGIKSPLVEMKEREYGHMSREQILDELIRYKMEIESLHRAGII